MEPIVKTKQLTKVFSGREVVRGLDLCVEQGTIYGLLGRNGAGKTTVFKLLLGLLTPTRGEARLFGMDSVSQNREILRRTGSLIETPIFYEHLSATENLALHLAYMGLKEQGMEEALKRVGLSGTGSQAVSTFSLGMRQRLAIARALIHRPKLLILDEPANGLDPVGIRDMRELFLELVKKEGMTILLSSHILSEIEQMADRVGIIADGIMVEETTPKEVKERNAGSMEDYFIAMTAGGKKHE